MVCGGGGQESWDTRQNLLVAIVSSTLRSGRLCSTLLYSSLLSGRSYFLYSILFYYIIYGPVDSAILYSTLLYSTLYSTLYFPLLYCTLLKSPVISCIVLTLLHTPHCTNSTARRDRTRGQFLRNRIVVHDKNCTAGLCTVQPNTRHCTVNCALRTSRTVLLWRLWEVRCTVYTVWCTLYTIQCTVYSVHCAPVELYSYEDCRVSRLYVVRRRLAATGLLWQRYQAGLGAGGEAAAGSQTCTNTPNRNLDR